jgi:hypothetical protein
MGIKSSNSFRCMTLLGIFALIALAMGLNTSTAVAQQAPTGEFQLDGTAALNTSYPICVYGTAQIPCDYWDLLNGSGGTNPTGAAGHSTARTFINGESSTESFTGGGSKDPNPISQWSCSTTPTPNKDTLTNGYAAAYIAPNKDLVTIFGADRLSVNGDANIGIWFFQNTVVCNPATGKFSGSHSLGDIFVISAFTQGGSVPTISVFEWDGSCSAGVKNPAPGQCADANLRLEFSAGSLCDNGSTVSTLAACAITNTSPIPVSWPYPTASSSVPSTIPTQAFFTGGVDVTNLLKTQVCFTSFLEETRSSQSTTAVLKDFLGGSFPVCSISVSKSCPNPGVPNATGTGFTDTWTGNVCNTSAASLTGAQILDTLPDGSTTNPTLSSTNLGPAGSGTDCATYTVTFSTTALTATNTAGAKAFFGSAEIDPSVCNGVSGTNCTAQATCHNSASSSVGINKHCVAPGITDLQCGTGGCVVVVPYSAQVCNNGTSQLTNIQVADYPNPGTNLVAVSPNGFTLNPGECTGTSTTTACTSTSQCTGGDTCVNSVCTAPANPTGTYIPTNFDSASTGTTNGRFSFDDKISVTSAHAVIGSQPAPVSGCTNSGDLACSGQTCPLCPLGDCSTSSTLP